jgi:hypothetical protein
MVKSPLENEAKRSEKKAHIYDKILGNSQAE